MLVVNLKLCTAYLLFDGKTLIIPNQTENLILSRVFINKFTLNLVVHKLIKHFASRVILRFGITSIKKNVLKSK